MKKILSLVIITISLSSLLFAQSDKIHWRTVEEVAVLQETAPRKVLMDVYTTWCGPCKMIGPLLVELSEEYAKKVKIVKLNVDENNNTAIQYAVRSIPTLILFKDGQVQAQHIGAAAKGQLKQFIDSNL